jgi:Zn-dependent protease
MEIAIISLLVLVFSVILHEVAHGYMADMLGDTTARYAGRLTLNPIPHIDLYGSIIVPGLLLVTHSPILFGWAKPVPYNPHNIKNPYGEALVAGAGPAVNLLLACVFGFALRAGFGAGDADITRLLLIIVQTNVLLCVFNLFPIPPLDGSKIFSVFLPRSLAYQYDELRRQLEGNPLLGMVAIIALVTVFGGAFDGVVTGVVRMIVGV